MIPDEVEKVISPVARIKRETAAHFGLTEQDLTQSTDPYAAHARQVAMWLARKTTKQTLVEIGKRFGRDHTTVLGGVNAVEGSPSLYRNALVLRERLG